MLEGGGNKRQADRQPVLKAAKVLFGNSAVDCLVLDMSAAGLRISTEAPMPFPEQVTIELRSGGSWTAALRWQRGLESGFELVRFKGLHAQAAADASALYDQLRNAGLRDVTERLAIARHFDHPALRSAAEAAAAAVTELEHVLREAAGR